MNVAVKNGLARNSSDIRPTLKPLTEASFFSMSDRKRHNRSLTAASSRFRQVEIGRGVAIGKNERVKRGDGRRARTAKASEFRITMVVASRREQKTHGAAAALEG